MRRLVGLWLVALALAAGLVLAGMPMAHALAPQIDHGAHHAVDPDDAAQAPAPAICCPVPDLPAGPTVAHERRVGLSAEAWPADRLFAGRSSPPDPPPPRL